MAVIFVCQVAVKTVQTGLNIAAWSWMTRHLYDIRTLGPCAINHLDDAALEPSNQTSRIHRRDHPQKLGEKKDHSSHD